jgi:hypothetical protein
LIATIFLTWLSDRKIFMPKIRFILFFVAVLYCSCKKEDNTSATSQGGLNGRWKMTAVMDKGIGPIQAPTDSDGKVFIEFNGESFSGKTMKNTITNGVLLLNKRDSITFGSYTSTLVGGDNQSGGAFMTMLSSCMLQSLFPCRPSVVTWKSTREIEINTAMRYTITLEKF